MHLNKTIAINDDDDNDSNDDSNDPDIYYLHTSNINKKYVLNKSVLNNTIITGITAALLQESEVFLV